MTPDEKAQYVAAAREGLELYNRIMLMSQFRYTESVRAARERYLANPSWRRLGLKPHAWRLSRWLSWFGHRRRRRFWFVCWFTARERELAAIAAARRVYDEQDANAWGIYADNVRPTYESTHKEVPV